MSMTTLTCQCHMVPNGSKDGLHKQTISPPGTKLHPKTRAPDFNCTTRLDRRKKTDKLKQCRARSDLVGEGLGEAAEPEVDLAERLAGGEELALREVLDGDLVVDPQPLERLDVLAAALVDVADDVGPAGLLLPVPLRPRLVEAALRRPQLVHLLRLSPPEAAAAPHRRR
jgi:hypothetical protein